MRTRSGVLVVAAVLAGCTDAAEVPDDDPVQMEVGEVREVDLRFLRFDVEGFEKTNTLDDLRAMPRRVLEDIWLVDLNVEALMVNSLEQLRTLSRSEIEELSPAAQNMQRLITMTPDNALLEGTNLEELISLSGSVGVPPARALANLLDVGLTDDFISADVVGEVMLSNVIGSHPATQTRSGPPDDEHPDGVFPVAEKSLPLTLADVVTNFENMAERFGPSGEHPGFIRAARGVSVIEEDFRIISKVNINALPYKGIDLSSSSVASVNSAGSQIESLHDFDDPDWIRMEGLVDNPTVEEVTFAVSENPRFVAGGTAREPVGFGNSEAWDLNPWEFEHLIIEMSRQMTETIPGHCDDYELGTGTVAFNACIDDQGWVELRTFTNVGSPPAPAYLWDLNLEIAQARMHDGGLAEGEANVEFTVRNVEVGVPVDELVENIRQNIQANPVVLREFAGLLTDTGVGDADFYYYRSEAGDDWLYFVSESDIRLDDNGVPVRDYLDYDTPGLYWDRDLDDKATDFDEVDGDIEHEKVRIEPGDALYLRDDDDRTFELSVGEKPSRATIQLTVTRLD